VRVEHSTLVRGEGPLVVGEGPVRTGVTVVCPREGLARDEPVFAGSHRFNGNGEMTGLEWIREAGVLETPVAITNTSTLLWSVPGSPCAARCYKNVLGVT
jgi:D-aminopeptidase